MPTEPPDTGGGHSRRIRKVWIVLAVFVGLAVVVRVALPYLIPWAVGWGAMRQAGLAAYLENVDLWLLEGAIALEGLAVAQGDDPPPDGQTPNPDTALLALDRVYLDFAWLDLFRGMLHVTEIDLERPQVKVQRLGDGRIDPLGQGPGPPGKREEPEPEPEPEPEVVTDAGEESAEEPGWPIVVDQLAIRNVGLRILGKPDEEELAAVDLEELVLQQIRLHGTAFGLGGLALTQPAIRVKREFALDPTGGRSPATSEEPTDAEGTEAETATGGKRRAFRIDDLDIQRAAFTLLVGEQTMDLALRLKATDVTLDPGASFPLAVGLKVEDGRLEIEGTAGAIPPFFDGTVKWQNLPVPPLTLIARPELQEGRWIKSCRAAGDLKVLARLGVIEGSGESPGVRVSGTVQVSDVEISDPSGEEIRFAWKSFDAEWSEVAIPMGDLAATTAPRIALASVGLTEPSILYTQPSPALQKLLAGQQPEEQATADEDEAAEEAPEDEAPSEEAAPAGPKPEVTIDRFELRGGEIRFNDNAVEPRYRGVIERLEVTAQGIDAMAPSAEKVVVDAKLPGGARLDVNGKVSATDGDLRLDVKRMDLPPVNPYAAAAGVEVARGSLSLGADIRAEGAQWNIDSDVTLHHLRLDSEGSKTFVEKLDMPVDLILSVLRSPSGEIAIPVTVAFKEGKAGVDVVEIIMGALRQALVGAASIPLKALGGVFGGGGGVDFAPIRALPGAVQPTEGAEEKLANLVDLLESRPGLAVKLAGQAGDQDRLFLAEAELADQLAAGGDFPELPDGQGAGLLGRSRIKGALGRRAKGEPLSLSEEDQVHLRRYLAQVEVPDQRYDELARDRARAVQRVILATERVDASRVELADPGRGTPGVDFSFDAIPLAD